MKRAFLIVALMAWGGIFSFAEYLGNKPSIDLTFTPEAFCAFEITDGSSDLNFGGGIDATLQAHFKLANFVYGYGDTLETQNVFGFYVKSTYSAVALMSRQYFGMTIGGGIHVTLPILPIGAEVGVSYNPLSNKWGAEMFAGYFGQKVAVGARNTFWFGDTFYAMTEIVFGWNFRFDIRNKQYAQMLHDDWILNHTYTKKVSAQDIPYVNEKIQDSPSTFANDILDIPLTVTYFTERDGTEVLQKIAYTKHTLSSGTPGTNEYTAWKSKTVTLPFSTDEEKQNAFQAIAAECECQRQQKERIAENERIAQSRHDAIYEKAVATKNVDALAEYVKENRYSRYFHDEVYAEIARLVAKDNSIELRDLPYISNPYNLDKNCLYYARSLAVYQWTGNGSFLAKADADKVIFIRNAYDLSKVYGGVENAYLRYIGTYEYNSVSADVQAVAQFDLVYSIGCWYYEP